MHLEQTHVLGDGGNITKVKDMVNGQKEGMHPGDENWFQNSKKEEKLYNAECH